MLMGVLMVCIIVFLDGWGERIIIVELALLGVLVF